MSERLRQRFQQEINAGRKLFVPFITAGDRGMEFTRQAIVALAEAGADAIELGVPFSDPLVDGKVIQNSYQRSLALGTHLNQILEMVQTVRKKTEIALLLMGSYNPFFRPGIRKVCTAAAHAGVDGFIVPDLPPEEGQDWIENCRKHELDTIFLATPLSTEKRLQAIAKASKGYIYYVSVAGTTGTRAQLPKDMVQSISRIRKHSQLPVLIGFGISTPEQAQKASQIADGVIVGSALVKTMETGQDASALAQLICLVKAMVQSVKKCS